MLTLFKLTFTQKTKLVVKTFIGREAINALKIYIAARKTGTENITPENITKESPLFRTWEHGTVKRIARGSMSSLIRQAFLRADEQKMSAHSLRKILQTDLEKAGINSNWIDQILGHQLINSRDAYSLPTDEELAESYRKAYCFIKIYPDTKFSTIITKEKTEREATIQTTNVRNRNILSR